MMIEILRSNTIERFLVFVFSLVGYRKKTEKIVGLGFLVFFVRISEENRENCVGVCRLSLSLWCVVYTKER